MFKNFVENLEKKSSPKKLKNKKIFGLLELPEVYLKTSNTHNF
jgi:hypothetical protein